MTFVMSLWKVERMMGDDDSYYLRFKLGKFLAHPGDLSLVNAPTLNGERPRSIDPQHGNFIVVIKRSQVAGDVVSVFGQRLRKPREYVVQRDIVIPWHDDLRLRQTIEKSTRFRKLMRTGTLRQISRDCHQVRIDLCDRIDQGIDDVSVDASKMYIRKMDYRSHGSIFRR